MSKARTEQEDTHREVFEDETALLTLGDFLRVVGERLWLILSVTLVPVGAAVGFSLMQTPMYEASIKILVGQEQGSSIPGNLGSDVQGLEQLTKTMTEGVKSYPLAEAVIQQDNLQMTPEDLLNHLSVKQIADTQFMQVTYADPSPTQAQRVANTIGDVFSNQVSEVSLGADAITATVWEPARVPNKPASPNFVLNVGLALLIGLMLGVGLALLLEHLDDGWRSREKVTQEGKPHDL